MHTKADFLRTICDDPTDTNLRLVYADFLDDNGEPERAEFIRLQCEEAVLDPLTNGYHYWSGQLAAPKWVDRVTAIRRRCVEMKNRDDLTTKIIVGTDVTYRSRWQQWSATETWEPFWDNVEFARGFADRFLLNIQTFFEKAVEIVRTHPVTEFRLTDLNPWSVGNPSYRFGWTSDLSDMIGIKTDWFVPPALFEYLPPSDVHLNVVRRWYSSYNRSIEALSVACVRWARQGAGLPHLTLSLQA